MNPSSLAHPAHLAQISPGLTLPSWAVAVLVAIVTGVLGFAWRLAVKAERSADKLETAVERLTALESRIAVIAALAGCSLDPDCSLLVCFLHLMPTGSQVTVWG